MSHTNIVLPSMCTVKSLILSPRPLHMRNVASVSTSALFVSVSSCDYFNLWLIYKESAYELRYVAPKPNSEWSVRQMAVYHGVRMSKTQAALGRSVSDDLGTLRSTFIVISAPLEIKEVIRSYSRQVDSKNGDWAQCFEIHLLILHELLGTWRPYLRWLTVELASSVRCYLHPHMPLLTLCSLERPFLLALKRQAKLLMHEKRARSWKVPRIVSNIVCLVLSVCSTLPSPLLEVTKVMSERARTGMLWMMTSHKHSERRIAFWPW